MITYYKNIRIYIVLKSTNELNKGEILAFVFPDKESFRQLTSLEDYIEYNPTWVGYTVSLYPIVSFLSDRIIMVSGGVRGTSSKEMRLEDFFSLIKNKTLLQIKDKYSVGVEWN